MCLWCIDRGNESVLCIDVKCAKTCCFETNLKSVEHCSSKWAQNRHEDFQFWVSLLHTTIPKKNYFVYIKMTETQGKQGAPQRKRLRAGQPTCMSNPCTLPNSNARTDKMVPIVEFGSIRRICYASSWSFDSVIFPRGVTKKAYHATSWLRHHKLSGFEWA